MEHIPPGQTHTALQLGRRENGERVTPHSSTPQTATGPSASGEADDLSQWFRTPCAARIRHHALGGRDCYQPDRDVLHALCRDPNWDRKRIARTAAGLQDATTRSAQHLTELGVDQVLVPGAGYPLPAAPDIHEIIQHVSAAARIVYVTDHLVVQRHGQALTSSTPEGRVHWTHARSTAPQDLLGGSTVRQTLDMTRRVGIVLHHSLHLLPDAQAHALMGELTASVPRGSILTVAHLTADLAPHLVDGIVGAYREAGIALYPRREREVLELLDGWRLLPHNLLLRRPGAWVPLGSATTTTAAPFSTTYIALAIRA